MSEVKLSFLKRNGYVEIGRWTKAHGETLVLLRSTVSEKTRLVRSWTRGARYRDCPIPAGRRANGGPIYSERPTLEQAEAFAAWAGFERVATR